MKPTTRGRRGPHHVLITPSNRYASRVPHLPDAEAFKLVSPRLAPARFAQTLLRVARKPQTSDEWPTDRQHFIYILGGETSWQLDDRASALASGQFLYVPAGSSLRLTDASDAQILHLARRRDSTSYPEPPLRIGHRADERSNPTGVPGLTRQELLPADDPAFDFTMSIMSFAAGAELGQIEIHDEEHGLFMLAGGGDYLLDGEWLSVRADDFIYMAPYCPQSFIAGPSGGEYLLYKDAWRESL